jgi:quercetin dioxygenase-like cupin family protein
LLAGIAFGDPRLKEAPMEKTFFPDSGTEWETIDPGKVTRKVRAHGGKLMLVEVSFAAGGVGSLHEHAHDQATYCLAGEFRFTIGAETRTLKPGDSAFIPGGERHGTTCVSEGALLDTFSPQREDFLKKKEQT